MDQTVSEEHLNDNAKLESKVIRALSRIQKKTVISGKLGKKAGVSVKQIVKYLKANFCGLDGDLESQVMTALIQCIKNGLVCAIKNGRYLLLGPKTKSMTSNCFSRIIHGATCSCAKKVPSLNACCTVNVNIETPALSRRRRLRKKHVNFESTEAENKIDEADTLCDNCFEIHPVSETSPKKQHASQARKTFTAPLDTFSPRDEVNATKATNAEKKKK